MQQSAALLGGNSDISSRGISSPWRQMKHEGLEGKSSLALSVCYQAALGLIGIPTGLGLEAPQRCRSFQGGGLSRCTVPRCERCKTGSQNHTHPNQRGGYARLRPWTWWVLEEGAGGGLG